MNAQTSVQSLIVMIEVSSMFYLGYYSIMSKQAKNIYFNYLLSLLEHGNVSVRNAAQESLKSVFKFLTKESKKAVFGKFKRILMSSTSTAVKKEAAVNDGSLID